jgi:nitrite reductase/ring-hydroxylating ferredoxin subunit/DMSO/TMAO reductase YedYZ heme-binding membrane subunit
VSVGFKAVQWNRDKYVYDSVLIAAVAIFLGAFTAIYWQVKPPKNLPDAIDIWVRALGCCAFLMLTVILCIGPLARLSPRFLPLLYNRRHFGVLTFLVALVHAWLMIEWYLAQDSLPSLWRELTKWSDYFQFIGFPFKILGLGALVIMFLMAATSHDFWLDFLTPAIWKALHMAVYAAYGLAVMHVSVGVLQYEYSPLLPAMMISSLVLVCGLHLAAGWREHALDRGTMPGPDGWIAVGPPTSIPDKAARIISAPGGERIAVFRDGGQIGALTNLCAHQNGPLGEGRIIDGCVTCPWHGFQYKLEDGCAPAPFTEKLATYPVRLRDGIVEVYPDALPPGTPAAIMCPVV